MIREMFREIGMELKQEGHEIIAEKAFGQCC